MLLASNDTGRSRASPRITEFERAGCFTGVAGNDVPLPTQCLGDHVGQGGFASAALGIQNHMRSLVREQLHDLSELCFPANKLPSS